MKPETFIFESCFWDANSGQIKLVYSLDGNVKFEEILTLPKNYGAHLKSVPQELIEKALFNLHLIGGVSYYKTFCPKKIRIESGSLNKNEAEFWNKLYTQGLGEFFYENNLDFRGLINFPIDENKKSQAMEVILPEKNLVPLGGGKDSIVACELMKAKNLDFDVFNLGGTEISKNVAKKMSKDLIVIKRSLSEKLFELNASGAMNGHIPITAYISFLSIFMSLIYGYDSVVFANEASANFGNLQMHGMEINHQYSKSLEFEQDLDKYLSKNFSPSIKVFSLLRPWYEIRIAQEYAKMSKFHKVATSCNSNFKLKNPKNKTAWCGECPKCAFVFAILSPFIDKKKLVDIFGKNLFADEKLVSLYSELIGKKDFKPFECVGTPEEVKYALYLASKKAEYKEDIIVKKLAEKVSCADLFQFKKEHCVPEKFLKVFNPRFLILGFGLEGKASYEYLRKHFPDSEIGIADKNTLEIPKDTLGHLGADYLDSLPYYDLIIKAPGIPWQKEFNEYEQKFSSATQIFFDSLDSSNIVIAITGSKGKSTVSSLMAEVLKICGKPNVLIGNIGEPMLRHIDKKNHFLVVELSSYQLERLSFRPKIAVVTSFFPDHLDYHGDLRAYKNAKFRIGANQKPEDFLIYHKKYKEIHEMQSSALKIGLKDYEPVKAKLLGAHNQDNIALVRTACTILGLDSKIVDKAIANFSGLPHRLEEVAIKNGITYIDDANATTPEGTLCALKTFEGKIGTLFLGGQDRGYDFTDLCAEIVKQKIPNLILFPESGAKIKSLLPKNYLGSVHVFETNNMQEAVKWSSKNTPKNSICLLSMASPSYGIFKNFQDKGEQFQKAVRGVV